MKIKDYERQIYTLTHDIFDEMLKDGRYIPEIYNKGDYNYWPPTKMSIIGDLLIDRMKDDTT